VSRYYSYLNISKQIFDRYKGEEPLATFLKKYFAQHKKYGSTDRKQIAHLCYCYFRLGKALLQIPVEEGILTGLFLCSTQPNEMLKKLKPQWNEEVSSSFEKKYSMLNTQLSTLNIFPWKEELSEEIEYKKFCKSFFIQPDLFIRLRPGREQLVKQKFQEAGIEFKVVSDTCLALPNSSKIDKVIELDKEAVVQDYSSQYVGEFLKPAIANLISITPGTEMTIWDCCAGSGGKSLLLKDINPNIDLTVSDIRKSILINLKKRFEKARIKKYKSFVADLSCPDFIPPQAGQTSAFGLIICDAPCTGSGTWSRTPEQLYYFDENKIEEYAALQKKIVSNVIPHLKPGGYFAYITCSVFKKENEEVVEFVKKNFHLELIKIELLKGYDKKTDTMFTALLRKPL
jgi:16S rRNA (cytosine967-C5)-methyltransferase